MNKKYLLPIGIVAGLGVVYLVYKKMSKTPQREQPIPKPQPQIVDSPQKKALRDEILNTIRDRYLQFYKDRPATLTTTLTNTSNNVQDYTYEANIIALKTFDCMMSDLERMNENELLNLVDYLKNGVPIDLLKYKQLINASAMYQKAYSDNPCSDNIKVITPKI